MIEREMAKLARPASAAPPVELDEDDEGRAARLFLAMSTQWNWSMMGVSGMITRLPTGLRYEALPVVAGAHGITVDRLVLADLQLMEAEAMAAMVAR